MPGRPDGLTALTAWPLVWRMEQPFPPAAVPPEAIWRVVEVWGRVPGAHAAALENLAAQGWQVHHTCWVRPLQHGAPRMAFVVAWRVEDGARH